MLHDSDVIGHYAEECTKLGMEYSTLETCVSLGLRECALITSATPAENWGPETRFPLEILVDPQDIVDLSEGAISRCEACCLWWDQISGAGNVLSERFPRKLLTAVCYLISHDMNAEEAAETLGIEKNMAKAAYMVAIGSVSTWLWNSSDRIKQRYPKHYRLPDAAYIFGEHHASDTPSEECMSPMASGKRWRGLVQKESTIFRLGSSWDMARRQTDSA